MPDRSKVMTQTTRDVLVLQIARVGVALKPIPPQKCFFGEGSRIGNWVTAVEEANVHQGL
jgi:hypothetical protein